MARFSLGFVCKLFIGIAIGIYVALSGLRSSGHLEQFFKTRIHHFFQDHYHCSLSIEEMDIHLIPLKLKIKQLAVTAQEQGWSFTTQNISISIDFLSSIAYKKIAINAQCSDCSLYATDSLLKTHIFSATETKATINRTLPLRIDTCTIEHFMIKAIDTKTNNALSFSGNIHAHQKQNVLHSTINIIDGSFQHPDHNYCDHITGSIDLAYHLDNKPWLVIEKTSSLSTHLQLPHRTAEILLLQGSWSRDKGSIALSSTNPAIAARGTITLTTHNDYTYVLDAQLPLSHISAFHNVEENVLINGSFLMHAQGTRDAQTATLSLKNIGWYTTSIDDLSCTIKTKNKITSGDITIMHKGILLKGTGNYNHNNGTFSGDFTNPQPLELFDRTWKINSQAIALTVNYDPSGKSNINHDITLLNEGQDRTITTKGNIFLNEHGSLHGHGSCNTLFYTIKNEDNTDPHAYTIAVNDQHKTPIFSLAINTQNQHFKSNVAFEALRKALIYLHDYPITGKGSVILEGTWQDGLFTTSLKGKDLIIRLPETYNLVTNITGSIEGTLYPFACKGHDISLFFNKGVITSHELICDMSNTFTLKNLFIPLHFRKCFINWKDRFIGTITGFYLLTKNESIPYTLQGFLTIEDGLVTENVLALSQNKTEAKPIPYVIKGSIMTKKPIGIKCPQVQSSVTGLLTLDNTPKKMSLDGHLHLHGGTIEFPYKPLSIGRAEIHFSDNHHDNPALDIVLQGLLKKYSVTVSVSGNAQDPQIALESTPTLNDEQIIELLLTGSTGNSLSAMVPSIVMKNIESIIFSNTKQLTSSFSALMEPLKRIHFIPSFVDQSEKGGIKGAIDIEISDYLHALYQKNFDTEYTRVECEYIIGDDISLRAMKDERDDLGGEIEMRFTL